MEFAEEVMDILEAFDLTGSYRDAAELADSLPNTVARYVAAREASRLQERQLPPMLARTGAPPGRGGLGRAGGPPTRPGVPDHGRGQYGGWRPGSQPQRPESQCHGDAATWRQQIAATYHWR